MSSFDGLSVLLLEDEYLIAMDTDQTLTSFGVAKVNVVNTLEDAAKAGADEPIDVAILDININGRSSFEIAERLREKGTPVIFASGYGSRKRHAPPSTVPSQNGSDVKAVTKCCFVEEDTGLVPSLRFIQSQLGALTFKGGLGCHRMQHPILS